MSFNSEEYAWKDLKVVVAGRPITGIRGIKYKVTRTITDIYASGDKPHTRTKGNKTYEGEIVLLQSEVEALTQASQELYGPKADITDLRFDVSVAYAVGPQSKIVVDQLTSCDIEDFEKGMQQGDANMEVTLKMKIGQILYNV